MVVLVVMMRLLLPAWIQFSYVVVHVRVLMVLNVSSYETLKKSLVLFYTEEIRRDISGMTFVTSISFKDSQEGK